MSRSYQFALFAACACGSGASMAIVDSGTSDDASSADSGCSLFAGPYPVTVTTADKSCASTSDCAVFVHRVDCAWSLVDIGVDTLALPGLEDAEAAQRAVCTYKCFTPPSPTVADDGTNGGGASAGNPTLEARVRCIVDGGVGRCMTSFADGGSDATAD